MTHRIHPHIPLISIFRRSNRHHYGQPAIIRSIAHERMLLGVRISVVLIIVIPAQLLIFGIPHLVRLGLR